MTDSCAFVRVARHKRQIVLFLSAIVLPAAVLLVLAGHIIVQERELATKRVSDQRQAAVSQLRRELGASLEAIKLQEINRQIRPHSQPQESGNPAVVFTATLDGDRLVLPWEVSPPPDSAEFARPRQEGELQEFVKKDNAAAAAAYRLALAVARSPLERAEARLALARALSNAGNAEEAFGIYKNLLNDSSAARDDQGVGYGFYAAEGLLKMKRDSGTVSNFVHQELEEDTRLTLPELYMARDLLGTDARISPRIAQMEQCVALSKDLPRLRAQMESGAAWVPYGPHNDDPLLVTMVPSAPPSPALVLAVSSARVAPPGVRLKANVTEGAALGELLGDAFPGLRVEWSDNRFLEISQGVPLAIWIAGLSLVLGIAVFGGYLLLKDVNRDIRMTEVRAQFIANVSHELKTPLTAIRMFAETLSLGRSRDERTKSEYLETIVNESERLARLVDNVLDFSKIEQGKKIYCLRPTRLEDVAGSAIRAMQFALAQEGFKVHLAVQEGMPVLQADPDAIQQATLNLLTNAMKYSGDSREIDLRVGVRGGTRNGDAVIEVADHGLGLALDERKLVFEKFYRAPSHESRLIAGTGLGLTLVAHIAKAHGGRVEVESTPGAGSTFSILLPVHGQNDAENGVHA